MENTNMKTSYFGKILSAICALVIVSVAAFSLIGCTAPEEPPKEKQASVTFAMLSDIHLQREDVTATHNFKRAVDYCKELGGDLDAVVVAGDLLDDTWWSHLVYEDERVYVNNKYKYESINHLKSILEDTVPEGSDFIYCLGNHDTTTFTNTPGTPSKNSSTEYYATLKSSERNFFSSELDPATLYNNGLSMDKMRRYGIGYYKIKNTHFITIDCVRYWVSDVGSYSETQLEWLDNALKSITESNPKDNVFIITHNPVQDTVLASSGTAGANDLKPILKKYPNVVTVTGHIHMNCYTELGISQDLGFTCVEGCSVKYTSTYNYNNEGGFNIRYSQDSYSTSQGLLVTVYDNSEVKIQRLDFTSKREAGKAWVLPEIGDKTRNSVYSTETRNKNNTAPYFENTTLKAEKAALSDVLNVKFAPAKDNEYEIYAYRARANYEDGSMKEYLLDSGFALPERIKEYCVSFENASKIKSVSVVAEDAWFKQSQPLTLDRAAFTSEQTDYASSFVSDDENKSLGSVIANGVNFAASDNFYEENGVWTNYKSMRAEGNLYFASAYATDYTYSIVPYKMRLNKAYTTSGFAYSDYRLGLNLASFEYNGRIFSLVADFNFGYYYSGEGAAEDRRVHTNVLTYYLFVSSSSNLTHASVYEMSRFGIESVELPENLKSRLRSDDGAKIIVTREDTSFKIMVDDEVIDTKDLGGGFFVNGRYFEFTPETHSAFGIHCSGAEAYFKNAIWTMSGDAA